MSYCLSFFFFNDTATTEIYTLSLHDALPISPSRPPCRSPGRPSRLAAAETPERRRRLRRRRRGAGPRRWDSSATRSEEHTSELQSRQYLVCRLLLEKKKKILS